MRKFLPVLAILLGVCMSTSIFAVPFVDLDIYGVYNPARFRMKADMPGASWENDTDVSRLGLGASAEIGLFANVSFMGALEHYFNQQVLGTDVNQTALKINLKIRHDITAVSQIYGLVGANYSFWGANGPSPFSNPTGDWGYQIAGGLRMGPVRAEFGYVEFNGYDENGFPLIPIGSNYVPGEWTDHLFTVTGLYFLMGLNVL
ncbi:hypothetical protein ACFL96_00765 [Thermoproteota archaeon]